MVLFFIHCRKILIHIQHILVWVLYITHGNFFLLDKRRVEIDTGSDQVSFPISTNYPSTSAGVSVFAHKYNVHVSVLYFPVIYYM